MVSRRGGGRREPRLHPFREEGADDAGEHVAGAGGGEAWIAAVDEDALPGSGDERARALEEDDAAESVDGAADGLEPVRVDPCRVLADQAPELAGVWGQDSRSGPVSRLELPERVPVDDGRDFRLR